MLRKLSRAIEKGKSKQAMIKMALSDGAKIRRDSDYKLIVSTVGDEIVCRFRVEMNNTVVVKSEIQLCIE